MPVEGLELLVSAAAVPAADFANPLQRSELISILTLQAALARPETAVGEAVGTPGSSAVSGRICVADPPSNDRRYSAWREARAMRAVAWHAASSMRKAMLGWVNVVELQRVKREAFAGRQVRLVAMVCAQSCSGTFAVLLGPHNPLHRLPSMLLWHMAIPWQSSGAVSF